MGKSKKRAFNRGDINNFYKLSREDAVKSAVEFIKENNIEAYGLITLFGLSAEELLEAGAEYEEVVKLGGMLK